jgi:putative ABC transport system permease protein
MRALPLFRFNRRAKSTSWGIAMCTMFIVASFSITAGLKTSMDTLADNFSSEYSLVSYPGESGMDFFDASLLGDIGPRSALCLVSVARVDDASVVVFSISDEHSVLEESLTASGDEVKAGVTSKLSGEITLEAMSTQEATVVSQFSSYMFPSTWLLGSEELLRSLTVRYDGTVNLAVSRGVTHDDTVMLESAGFSVQPMISIVEFLGSSMEEIENDMYWVLLPSSFVIAVLAYSFIGTEVSDKRHDIGMIKAIGASRGRVLSYLVGESVLICSYGGVLGLALGIVVSYAVSTFASHIFPSVFIVEMEEALLLTAFAVSVAAGILGSLIPAVKMTMTSPVQDLMGVG